MELKNKSVLVTGGAVRIGRVICSELAKTGAVIFCHYHKSKEAAILLKKEIEKQNGKIYLLHGDLSKIRFAEQLPENVLELSGRFDVLINNAAIFYKTPFGTVTEEDWNKLFNLNIKAAFFCAQAAGKIMRKQKSGKIINIGDAAGNNPWPSYIPYSLTKAAIQAMTRGLAKALAPDVQVNCINPGPVLLPENYKKEERELAIEKTLLKRAGSAGDIAHTVRFILEDSDFITGAMFNIDGGRSIV